jgi:hypothetical protein
MCQEVDVAVEASNKSAKAALPPPQAAPPAPPTALFPPARPPPALAEGALAALLSNPHAQIGDIPLSDVST